MKQRRFIALLAVVLVLVLCVGVLAACNKCADGHKDADIDGKCDNCGANMNYSTTKTYKTYATSFPTSWNVLDYETSDQGDMFSYSSSGFYEFDYKFDENGEVVDGEFSVLPTMASDFPTDITAEIATAEPDAGYAFSAEDEGYAWYIPIRKGMTWDNGDPIKLDDWIYSMKEQLNPLFQNHRADSYYNSSTVIHNAEFYVKQGQETTISLKSALNLTGMTLEEFLADATTSALPGYINWDYSYGDTYDFEAEAWTGSSEDEVVDTGLTFAQLYEFFTTGAGGSMVTDPETGWATYEEVLEWAYDELFVLTTIPEVNFEQVGLRAIDDGTRYGLILILDAPFVDTGSHFVWAYDFGGNWLVKPDVYESCKVAPAAGSDLWTSKYGTSVETSPSYGPYKLTDYQLGKFYRFSRNTEWFGYDVPELSEGCYETDAIECSLLEDWDTAWMAFQKGQLSAIGIDVKIADQYKTSERAYFTPSDFVSSLQIQSSPEALVDANDGYAKEILLNNKFRQALSLAIDRAEYTKQCTTSSMPGFGLYNSMHYYDVENGGVYRNTDIAKQVICNVYAVDVSQYDSLDDAYDAVVGKNIELAKQLVKEAIEEEIAAGNIKSTDILKITWGSSGDNEAERRPYNFIKNAWATIFEGSQFAGSGFEFGYDGTHGDNFAVDFRAGQYEVLAAGWSGAAWDPFYFMMAYVHPSYKYAVGCDFSKINCTFTLHGVDPETGIELEEGGEDATFELPVYNTWYMLYQERWSEQYCSVENRLIILAALEEAVLKTYYSIPVANSFGASLRSYQLESFTDTYNTFMGWGSVKYYSYNYTDGEWAAYIANHNGTIDYK